MSDTTVYKKRAIAQASRRALALSLGAVPGTTTPMFCAHCGSEGSAFWPVRCVRQSDGKWHPDPRVAGAWVHFDKLEIDHVHPERHGGTDAPENLQLLCKRCNRSKGSKV